MGYGSPAAALQLSISFSRTNPLLSRASRSSVFVLNFFHSRLGCGHGGDIGGAAPVAAVVASSRPLFFLAVFADLDGEGCRMDLPRPTTSVGTRSDYSVGPWDYPACATRHLKAWSTRTAEE
jgi:hypothetical protein